MNKSTKESMKYKICNSLHLEGNLTYLSLACALKKIRNKYLPRRKVISTETVYNRTEDKTKQCVQKAAKNV